MADLKRMDAAFSINIESDKDHLKEFLDLEQGNYYYVKPGEFVEFRRTADHFYEPYAALEQMFGNAEESNKAKTAKSNITKLLGVIQDMYKDAFSFSPKGQPTLPVGANASSYSSVVDDNSTWKYKGDQKSIISALADELGDFISSAANKALLMTYGTEMFSNYTSNRPSEDDGANPGEDGDKSMAGIPFNIDNNYMYQSEVEYLFNGSTKAIDNLKSVYGLLFAVRMVTNYTATFRVNEVRTVLLGLRSSVPGPVGFAIAEAARLAFAMGESVIDLTTLRDGGKVAMVKNNSNWKLSVTGLLDMTKENIESSINGSTEEKKDDEEGFGYEDYLLLFLLMVNGDVLAERMADLIQVNVNWVGEQSPSGSFTMVQAHTDYDIITRVEMKFLFLSLPMAQNFNNGTSAPTTFQVTASASRGY